MCSLVEMQMGPCNLVGVKPGIAEAAKQSSTMGKVTTNDSAQLKGIFFFLRNCIWERFTKRRDETHSSIPS